MLVQANARVPEDARPVLMTVAAKLRDDASFAKRLLAFLDDDAGGSPWGDRLAALEARVRALEEARAGLPPMVGVHDALHGGAQLPAMQEVHIPLPPSEEVPTSSKATAVCPPMADEPAKDPPEVDGNRGAEHHGWAARAAAVTLSTGEGRGRKLTPEGIALFEEMAGAGVGSAEIAKVLGMARQSVDTRRAKLTACGPN